MEEQDLEQWILTVEALDSQWREGWEGVVAARGIASPVVVFAGLGSPAAVLTKTVEKVRKGVLATHKVYVVDPSPTSAFEAALDVPDEAHIQMPWCPFAHELADRSSRAKPWYLVGVAGPRNVVKRRRGATWFGRAGPA